MLTSPCPSAGEGRERERTERETQAYDHQSIWDHHALACRLRAHRLVSSIHHICRIQSSNRKINERCPASADRPDPCIHPSIDLPASSLPDMQEKKHFFLLSSPLSSFSYLSLLPLTAKCGVYTRRSAASLPSFLPSFGGRCAGCTLLVRLHVNTFLFFLFLLFSRHPDGDDASAGGCCRARCGILNPAISMHRHWCSN